MFNQHLKFVCELQFEAHHMLWLMPSLSSFGRPEGSREPKPKFENFRARSRTRVKLAESAKLYVGLQISTPDEPPQAASKPAFIACHQRLSFMNMTEESI